MHSVDVDSFIVPPTTHSRHDAAAILKTGTIMTLEMAMVMVMGTRTKLQPSSNLCNCVMIVMGMVIYQFHCLRVVFMNSIAELDISGDGTWRWH